MYAYKSKMDSKDKLDYRMKNKCEMMVTKEGMKREVIVEKKKESIKIMMKECTKEINSIKEDMNGIIQLIKIEKELIKDTGITQMREIDQENKIEIEEV